jgi:hypothetical protein
MAQPSKSGSGSPGELDQIRLKAQLDAKAADELAKVNRDAASELAKVNRHAAGETAKSNAATAAALADVNAAAASDQAHVDEESATQAARVAYDTAFYQGMIDTAAGAPDRWRSAGELVQKSSAAIGTLYAGILGVTFSVSGHQLPVRGVVPVLFLGLAIAMSTLYVAYNTRGQRLTVPDLHSDPADRMQQRLDQFLEAVHESVDRRAYSLRASVLALAAGVLFLPTPFIAFSSPPAINLDQQHPWPSPVVVLDSPNASIVSILYKDRVDEVATDRQRAEAAASSTSDLGIWVMLTIVVAFIVLVVPVFTRSWGTQTTTSGGPNLPLRVGRNRFSAALTIIWRGFPPPAGPP